jgi:cyclic pyranopterin phosphate synthase
MEISASAGRQITYLRISVTDRCNLRCVYCVPPEGASLGRREEILRYEEISRIVEAVVPCGISRVRITGGEPLVRPQLTTLVRALAEIPGLAEVTLTTNGQLLAQFAGALREAGLRRINVSLDTLRPQRYREMTRGGELGRVFEGLAACREEGLTPIKINVVVIRGLNEDEPADFARLTLDEPYDVRFIEFMPMGETGLWSPEAVVPQGEIRAAVESLGRLEPAPSPAGNLGVQAWRLAGARGTIGFISPLSSPFCGDCNRLRLSAAGQLRPCLLSDTWVDLRAVLRSGGSDEDVRRAFLQAAAMKPDKHRLGEEVACHPKTPMRSIGG